MATLRTRHPTLIVLLAIAVAGRSGGAAETEAPPAVDGTQRAPSYSHVLVLPLRVAYTSEFMEDASRYSQRVRGEDLERIRRYYQEVVTETLAPLFPSASEPGPGVATLESVLIDHEIVKDDWKEPTSLAFRGAPTVQILAHVRNSQTGAIIDTVGLTLQPRPNRLMVSSPGNYWDFMRKVFDRLATRVRWRLEDEST
jgi:hypothetical protein